MRIIVSALFVFGLVSQAFAQQALPPEAMPPVVLSKGDWDVILSALSEGKFRDVAPTIGRVAEAISKAQTNQKQDAAEADAHKKER